MHKIAVKNRIHSILLVFTLVFLQTTSCLLVLAAPDSANTVPGNAADNVTEDAAKNAIHISSVNELTDFARSCTLDTWSVGKVFVLDTDIDLTGTDFIPIPTFGGTFLGQGHTISGLSLPGGSNHMALFRYVQEEGEISQLTVSGSARADSSHSGLALLAGVNCGIIDDCHASCTINGGEKAGGITGINEMTGVISNCSVSGLVTGDHLIGGIAGENSGTISGCQNHCNVNTIPDDNHIDLANIDIDTALTDLLTTENAASVTDIGGITGSNTGTVRGCVNDGAIGYQHVGYNIGGIAGSQSGFIEGCANYGILNGRKDIGGIVGQMEPSSHLQFDEDTLKKLNEEFNVLHDLFTKLDQDCGGSSSSLTGQVDQLLNSVENAQNAVDQILGTASQDFSSFAEPTDLTTLPSPKPVSLDFLDALPTISASPSPTPEGSATPFATPTPSAEPTPSVTPTAAPTATAGPASGTSEVFIPKPLSAPRLIQGGILYEPDGPDHEQKTPSPSPAETATPSPTFLWPDGWPTPSGNWDGLDHGIFDDIDREDVEKSINDAQQNIYEDASGILEDIQTRMQNRISVIGNRFDSARNTLGSSFSSIITDTRLLNSMLDNENQLVLNDFQAIIDELNAITDLITDPNPADPDEILEDISDEDRITDTTGKVMNCANKGLVNGDLNVGGIAGSLSRENNLDPENDFDLDQYDTTLNFRYQERIVVRQCDNAGKIEGKKDCIGGIAGEMLLGSIMESTNSGAVKSDGNKIGGIAGEGNNIHDCVSMVEIREGNCYLGSIAGTVEPKGEVSGCYFVEGCPAGIDGISYAGSAQPLAYEEFLTLTDLPDLFLKIYLTFEADGRIVDIIPLDYGESVSLESLPDVPKKDGFTGTWSDFCSSDITFDQTIEALYNEYITTLESDLCDGARPVLLAEGIFTPEDKLSVSNIEAYPQEGLTNAVCYRIHMTGSGEPPFTFRMLIPADMENPRLEWLDGQKNWISIPAEKDGSYLVFSLSDRDAVVSCVHRPATIPPLMIILMIILLAVLTLLLILFFLHRKKRP